MSEMKNNFKSSLTGIIMVILIMSGCKKADLPSITSIAVTNITGTSASTGGNVTSDGGASIIKRGSCWSTSAKPTVSNSITSDGTGTGTFTSNISGLSEGTAYHVRAYATNSSGTSYGEDLTFTTIAKATLSTTAISAITSSGAAGGGNISSDGGASVTERGVCWSLTSNPTVTDSKTSDDSGSGVFTSTITGLTEGTTYHLRAYATNSLGTAYGEDISFKTLAKPTLTTTIISGITISSILTGGNIATDGGATVTSRGMCWALTQNPTLADNKTSDGTGAGIFSSNITGLTPNTPYYLRSYATNSVGTSYGNELTFTTFAVMDIDGNGYHSKLIGTQTWLIENLRTTHYLNGDPIPNVTDNTQWYNLTSGAYCFKNNDTSVPAVLGVLYNWYTTNDSRNLCPTGWHVSTDSEWDALVSFLGGTGTAGGKMKLPGTLYWMSPNTGADNSSGFSGISGGQRGIDGNFFDGAGCFWTSTPENATNARDWFLVWNYASVTRYWDKKVDGFNIRCVKD